MHGWAFKTIFRGKEAEEIPEGGNDTRSVQEMVKSVCLEWKVNGRESLEIN